MNYGVLLVIALLYIGVTVYLGWLGYQHTKSSKDYMIAGGEVHPYLMAMGYGSTFISTSAIVGFGGAAAVYGMSLLWLTAFNIICGVFIAFVVLGTRTRALGQVLNVQTFPEMLGERFQSGFIRTFSAVVITVAMPLYAAAVMIGGARFMEQALRVNYTAALIIVAVIVGAYVMAGGMKGVLYTSAFQGTLMLLAMFLLMVLTYVKLGGISAAHHALTAMADQVPGSLVEQGHTGWTAMPLAGSQLWIYVITTLVGGVGIGVLAQPQLAVRYLTVKSNKDLYRALAPGGVFILLMTGVGFTVGALSNVFFSEKFGKISLVMSMDPVKNAPNIDKIIPLFITEAMPSWIGYIFLLTLLAAAMSTLSGQFHAIATSISYDLFKTGRGDAQQLKLARYATFLGFLVTLLVSFILPGSIIALATAIFFGLCAASFLPMYLSGLFWKRATVPGVTWGMVVGTAVYLFDMFFMHTKEATIFKLSQLLLGKDTIVGFPWNVIDPLVIALPASLIVTVIVSLVTQPMEQSHVDKCFGLRNFKQPETAKTVDN
jgi:SSS family solute:Na+ symporter